MMTIKPWLRRTLSLLGVAVIVAVAYIVHFYLSLNYDDQVFGFYNYDANPTLMLVYTTLDVVVALVLAVLVIRWGWLTSHEPRLRRRFWQRLGIVGLVVAAICAVWYFSHLQGAPAKVTGIIKHVDLSEMTVDGPGTYKVSTPIGEKTIYLSSGASDCDRTAIQIPSVVVGDWVEVKGVRDGYGNILVCEPGTYIRAHN